MGYIEIICTIIGAVAAILSGVWFIVNRAQKRAVNDYRLENMEVGVAVVGGIYAWTFTKRGKKWLESL